MTRKIAVLLKCSCFQLITPPNEFDDYHNLLFSPINHITPVMCDANPKKFKSSRRRVRNMFHATKASAFRPSPRVLRPDQEPLHLTLTRSSMIPQSVSPPPPQPQRPQTKSFFRHKFTCKAGECVSSGTRFGTRHLLSGWFLLAPALAGVGSTKGSVAFFKPLAAYVSSANIIGQQRIRLGQHYQRMLIAEWSPPMKNEAEKGSHNLESFWGPQQIAIQTEQ